MLDVLDFIGAVFRAILALMEGLGALFDILDLLPDGERPREAGAADAAPEESSEPGSRPRERS